MEGSCPFVAKPKPKRMSQNGVLASEWGWNRSQPEGERHEDTVAPRCQVDRFDRRRALVFRPRHLEGLSPQHQMAAVGIVREQVLKPILAKACQPETHAPHAGVETSTTNCRCAAHKGLNVPTRESGTPMRPAFGDCISGHHKFNHPIHRRRQRHPERHRARPETPPTPGAGPPLMR